LYFALSVADVPVQLEEVTVKEQTPYMQAAFARSSAWTLARARAPSQSNPVPEPDVVRKTVLQTSEASAERTACRDTTRARTRMRSRGTREERNVFSNIHLLGFRRDRSRLHYRECLNKEICSRPAGLPPPERLDVASPLGLVLWSDHETDQGFSNPRE
jgi:hypothetical protein